jgi:hypothetical protein
MQKLNFLVENMGATQLSYTLTHQLNMLSGIDRNIDGIVFYNTLHKHAVVPNFAIMQMIEAWNQKGTTVATSLATASQLLSYPGPELKIYYVWDLPWMRINPKIYGVTQEIMTNPNLLLLTRSESYADAISIAYNVDRPIVVENLDLTKLLEVINDVKT